MRRVGVLEAAFDGASLVSAAAAASFLLQARGLDVF